MEAAYQIHELAYKKFLKTKKQWGGNFVAQDVQAAWNDCNIAWQAYAFICKEHRNASV